MQEEGNYIMVYKLLGLRALVSLLLAYTSVDIWYKLRDIPRHVGRYFDTCISEIPHFIIIIFTFKPNLPICRL